MARLLGALAGVALVLGPPVVAYANLPAVVLLAWPLWALTFWPTLAVMVAGVPFQLRRGLEPADLPEDAAAWARRRLDQLGLIGIRVAALDQPSHGPFYHPGARTIVLPPEVHQHTARAYAVAGHELGHALFHHTHPRLGAWLMAARQHADGAFGLGVGVLLGAALVALPALYPLGLGLCALALVLAGLVVADEAFASHLAVAHLRDVLDAAQLARARRHLAAALATYLANLLACATPLVAGRWILERVDDLDLPINLPSGAAAALATVAALVVLAGAAAALAELCGLARRDGATVWLRLGSMAWAPLLVALVAGHPAVPGWRVALAVVPAWTVLAIPGWLVIALAANWLADDAPSARASPHPGVRQVSLKALAASEPGAPTWVRIVATTRFLWAVPLALWWLLA